MNWGYKILAVYLIFVGGIAFMVIKSSAQKIDLVTENYYDKELKYQQTIDQSKRVEVLSEPVRYQLKDGQLLVFFPKDFLGKQLTGSTELYCPADENKDMKAAFSIKDEPLAMKIYSQNKGSYELHITWQADGISYYFEKKIII